MSCQPHFTRRSLAPLLIALAVAGCRPETPELADRPEGVVTSPSPGAPADTSSVDTVSARAPRMSTPGYWSEESQPGGSAPMSERQQVLGTVNDLFSTIATGSEAELKSRLSARSLELLRSMNAESELWPIAREALGSIRDRRVRFLGGTPDSAALLITGTRTLDTTASRAELVLSVLREEGTWKVMYPGAQPYREHVGP